MEMALIDPTPKARLQCVNPSGLNALCLDPPTTQSELFIEEIALFFYWSPVNVQAHFVSIILPF